MNFIFEFQDGADGFFAAVLSHLPEQLVTPSPDDPLVVVEYMEQVPSKSQCLIALGLDEISFGGVVLDQQQQFNQPAAPIQATDPLVAANFLDLGGYVAPVDNVQVVLA